MNFKADKKIYMAVITAVIVIAAAIIFVGSTGLTDKYNEEFISFESLIDDAYEIKDFEAYEGRIKSLSDDPWIGFRNFSSEEVMCITIDVNYISDNYSGSEIFIMYENGALSKYDANLSVGDNIVKLNGGYDGIQTIRFDLLTGENQEIGINGVLLNDSNITAEILKNQKSYFYVVLIENIQLIFPLAAAFMAIALVIKIRRSDKNVKGLICAFVGMGAVFVLYVGFVVSGAGGIYEYKNMSLSEFTNDYANLKEFALYDNNVIVSETGDPWISYYDERANAIKTVTFNVDSLSLDPVAAQLFVFYRGTDTFDIIEYDITAGENTVIIPFSLYKIGYLRFDLVSKRDVEIGINSVEINKPSAVGKVLKQDVFDLFSKLFVWYIFIAAAIIMPLIGKRYVHIHNKNNRLINNSGNFIAALLTAAMLLTGIYGGILSVIIACGIGVFVGGYGSLYLKNTAFNRKICCTLLLILILLMYALIPETGINNMLLNMKSSFKISLILFLICEFGAINIIALLICGERKISNYKIDIGKMFIWAADAVIIVLMVISIEVLARVYLYDSNVLAELANVVSAENICINILLYGLIFMFIKKISGDFIGYILNIVFFVFMFIGNFVKLKYHDTVFKPMDILQIGDFLSIVTLYVKPAIFYSAVVIALVLILYLLYRKRRYILKFKPNICMAFVSLFFILYFSNAIYANRFADMGITSSGLWQGTESCVDAQGLVCYTYIEFTELSKIYPKASENYSEEYMEQLEGDFDKLSDNEVSDVKPNVILVMEESMFDVEKIPNVDFSLNLTENINKYLITDVISPKYGGGTASVEFEALTGLSNYFFLDNIVPYVTYWNNTKNKIPGLAEEFNANDYNTVAIHPNKGNVYNRDIVYECMEFDRFLDKTDMDFSDENITDDLYFKDEALADVINNELTNAGDTPSFIFAVTIENHTLYKNKYADTEVKLSSDVLGEDELKELEQYSEGVLSADRFIQKMVDIVDNADRPTILYIWGDHLPSLPAFKTLGFIDDIYNKYTTPLIAYSNYKDIEVDEEYITPNQIAPQILRDAEIEYSSYFDYIYSLRKSFPVIQKEFNVDGSSEQIKIYEEIQYDLLFGEQYLVDSD